MFRRYGNQSKRFVTIKFNKLRKYAAYGDQHVKWNSIDSIAKI